MKNSFKKTKRKTAAGVLALMLALSMILGSVSVPVLAAQAADETDITGTEFKVENETVPFPQDDFSSGIPEEETFAVEETRENAGEVITVTLDAGAEGYFIDENGVQVQTAATLWTAGSQVSELMTVLPAPMTDGIAVFAGWSFLEDGSELIPEEGFTAESDVTIYAVWNTGASDQDLLSAGDESGFEQAEVEGSGEDTWLPEGQNPETGSGEEISAGEVNGSGQPFGEGSFGEGGEEMWLPEGDEQAAGSGEEISAGAESGDGLTADGIIQTSTARIQPSKGKTRNPAARIQPSKGKTRNSTALILPSTGRTRNSTTRIQPSKGKTRNSTALIQPSTGRTRNSTTRILP